MSEIEERKLQLEIERVNIEKRKSETEQRFLNRNLGIIITGLISIATVVVSIIQLKISASTKLHEIKVEEDKSAHAEKLDEEKLAHQKFLEIRRDDREWGMKMADFVFKNRELIFSADPNKKIQTIALIEASFPEESSAELVKRIRGIPAVSDSQKNVVPKTSGEANLLTTKFGVPNVSGMWSRDVDTMTMLVEQNGPRVAIKTNSKDYSHSIKGSFSRNVFDVTVVRKDLRNDCVTELYGQIKPNRSNDKLVIDIFGSDGRCDLPLSYKEKFAWSRK